MEIIGLYVDDLLLMCDSEELMAEIKSKLNFEITVTDMENINQFLNLDVQYDCAAGIMKIRQVLIDFNL